MDGQTVASGVYSEVIALGVRFRSSGRVVDVRAPAGVCFDTRETPQSYHAYTRVPATPLQPHAVMPGVAAHGCVVGQQSRMCGWLQWLQSRCRTLVDTFAAHAGVASAPERRVHVRAWYLPEFSMCANAPAHLC